jgi:hypothetical protein
MPECMDKASGIVAALPLLYTSAADVARRIELVSWNPVMPVALLLGSVG